MCHTKCCGVGFWGEQYIEADWGKLTSASPFSIRPKMKIQEPQKDRDFIIQALNPLDNLVRKSKANYNTNRIAASSLPICCTPFKIRKVCVDEGFLFPLIY